MFQNLSVLALVGFILSELTEIYSERSALLDESQAARDHLRQDADYWRCSAFNSAAQLDDLRKQVYCETEIGEGSDGIQ